MIHEGGPKINRNSFEVGRASAAERIPPVLYFRDTRSARVHKAVVEGVRI